MHIYQRRKRQTRGSAHCSYATNSKGAFTLPGAGGSGSGAAERQTIGVEGRRDEIGAGAERGGQRQREGEVPSPTISML